MLGRSIVHCVDDLPSVLVFSFLCQQISNAMHMMQLSLITLQAAFEQWNSASYSANQSACQIEIGMELPWLDECIDPRQIVIAYEFVKREFKLYLEGFDRALRVVQTQTPFSLRLILPGNELARLCEDCVRHNGSRANGSLPYHMSS